MRRLLFPIFPLLLTVACAPILHVQRPAPARIDVGAATKLGLVFQANPGAVAQGAYTADQVKDYVQSAVAADLAAYSSFSIVGDAPEAVLRFEVEHWDYEHLQLPRIQYVTPPPLTKASLTVRVAVFSPEAWAQGAQTVPLSSDTISVRLERAASFNESAALQVLTDNLKHDLFERLRRPMVTLAVRYDDEDNTLSPGLELLRDGDVPAAHTFFATAVLARPESAEARFNLGVTYELQGDLALAYDAYVKARSLKDKPFMTASINRTRPPSR